MSIRCCDFYFVELYQKVKGCSVSLIKLQYYFIFAPVFLKELREMPNELL
jgi:hypothetical protein